MSNVVLLHGAWHGSWCFDYIKLELEKKGHNVITPDFRNINSKNGIIKWDCYIDEFLNQVNFSEKESFVLVAHSMSGVIASLIANLMPDKVEKIIYIAAYLLQNNESIMKYVRMDTASDLSNLIIFTDKDYTVINKDIAYEKFYNESHEIYYNLAIKKLTPQNIRIFKEKVIFNNFDFYQKIPKYYIACKFDRIISYELQLKMAKNAKCLDIISLDCDHFPFFSDKESIINFIGNHLALGR